MKKLLLSFLCGIMAVCMASAETYTYTYTIAEQEGFGATTNSALGAWKCGGFIFIPAQNDGNNAPAYNKKGDVRLYAGNSLSVKTENGVNITSISFAISEQGLERFPEVTPNVGEIAAQGVNPLVWNGASAEVVFTVGDKAIYGPDTTKPGQFDFTAVTITTDGEAVAGDEPVVPPVEPQGEVVTSLASLLDFENNAPIYIDVDLTVVYANGANVYVYDGANYGMIYKSGLGLNAGDVIAKGWNAHVSIYSSLTEIVPDSPVTVSGTAAVPEPIEVDAEMAPMVLMPYNQNSYVKLLAVAFGEDTPSSRSNFNGVMGEGDEAYTVTFRNNFSVPGVTAGTYDVVAFISVYNDDIQVYPVEYIGNSGEIQLPVLESFNMLYDLENNTEFKVGIDLTVVYSSGAYTYVNDGFQNALIYKSGLGLNAGDVIGQGWNASLSIYNNLLEIVPSQELTVVSTGAPVPAPIDVDVEEVSYFVAAYNQAAYLNLKNVVFAEATPASGSFTGMMGEEAVNFYQRFGLDSVEAGTYNVEGFVAIYKDTVQIYPTKFTPVAVIASVIADSAPVKYYNIQGIQIANPQPGNIYIRVIGDKASKVIM